MKGRLGRLRTLTADGAKQKHPLVDLERAVDGHVKGLEKGIVLYKAKGPAAVRARAFGHATA